MNCLQPNNIGYRKAWASGGCEWNWSPGKIGHSVFSESPVFTAVLHTDMKTHFDALASFNGRVTQAEEGVEDLSVDSADDRRMVLGMVLHCCDVSNMAKPRPIYLCVRRCLRHMGMDAG